MGGIDGFGAERMEDKLLESNAAVEFIKDKEGDKDDFGGGGVTIVGLIPLEPQY